MPPAEQPLLTTSLGSLLVSFLKIGSIGFGGGMAVIALMEKELVQSRRLIPPDDFVHGVGLGQGLGAFAVNVAVFAGYRLFGAGGALLSAGAFLLPSVILVVVLSDLYFRYHAIPALQSAVAGLSPVVVALILSAAWSIARRSLRSWPAALIAMAAFIAGVYHVNAAWVLLGAGAVGFLLPLKVSPPGEPAPPDKGKKAVMPLLLLAAPVATSLPVIVATFLKIGLVFFGGGFVLVPILQHRLVTELGWLKPQEFLDGLAISNLAPGPVALLATFAGYRLAGVPGALAATVSLFAPGILLMLVISRQYSLFRNDRRVQRFLAGVNPSVAGLLVSATPVLGRGAFESWRAYVLLALSFALLVGLRWPPAFVLAIGAVAGYFALLP